MRWRGIVVTILCGVLTLTTSSFAQSAWVLWLGTGTTYTPFGAFGGTSGEKDCKEAASQLMTSWASS